MLCTGEKLHETLISWHLQTHCPASRDPKQMGDSICSYGHWTSTPNTLPCSLPTSTWIAFHNSSSFNAAWIWCFNALWTTSIGWKCPLADIPINQATCLLLQHQHYATPQAGPYVMEMPFDSMMQGFQKWPECTSTSPSGRHLGIYKSLLKDINQNKKKSQTTNGSSSSSMLHPEFDGSHIIRMIHQVIQLAVIHCHTLKWWKMVWNLFLKKDIGNPCIDCLRAIHLVEVDLNMIWNGLLYRAFFPWQRKTNKSLTTRVVPEKAEAPSILLQESGKLLLYLTTPSSSSQHRERC